jgi:hypothetical protein
VNEVLVDGGELLSERTIQLRDDLWVTLHAGILQEAGTAWKQKIPIG